MTKTVDAHPLRVIRGIEELRGAVGQELGISSWHDVTQADIAAFAKATHDLHWIHTDPNRAAGTPLGATIAHGPYTLSLGPKFNYLIVGFEGLRLALNYAYNRMRFPAPLPVGSRIRMRLTLTDTAEASGSVQATLTQTFERSGGDRPVCVAEFLQFFVA